MADAINVHADLAKHLRIAKRMKPISKGSIFVFNCVQQGLYKEFAEQIQTIELELGKYDADVTVEQCISFGPFDNLIRVDNISDFSYVNLFSSLSGVGSQQIQCGYTIWKRRARGHDFLTEPHFGIVTQLKIQNHLILGSGPCAEEAIAELIIDRLKRMNCAIEIELLATLGWDEFIIILKNAAGYASLVEPIIDNIWSLNIEHLDKLGIVDVRRAKKIRAKNKHLFMATYSTPFYSKSLADHLETYFEAVIKRGRSASIQYRRDVDESHLFKTLHIDPRVFGIDEVHVSTRLSIKPGHLEDVNALITRVFEGCSEEQIPAKLISIGRYDIYPWLGTKLPCWKFAAYFELLRYSLSANKPRKSDFADALVGTKYYNSFTIISLEKDLELPDKMPGTRASGAEGIFIGQMKDVRLGNRNGKTIQEACKRETLRANVPNSIMEGLSRIFSLFDSCIMDRFTCDSFLDMYPFMLRLRDILDSVQGQEGAPLRIKISEREKEVPLPEYNKRDGTHAILIDLFDEAIKYFYHGLRNRYLSSYPMMDKNETGVDFSGRCHRILAGITGMQNILLDDLDCHTGKGFNVISTRPIVSISSGSFNISKANVFHLFEVEAICTLFHEIMHVFVSHDDMREIIDYMDEIMQENYPVEIRSRTRDRIREQFTEIAGDIFLLNNAFAGDMRLFGFWFWMFYIKSKGKIDSNLLLRFITVSCIADRSMRRIYDRYLPVSAGIEAPRTLFKREVIVRMLMEMIEYLKAPDEMVAVIKKDLNLYFIDDGGNTTAERFIINLQFFFEFVDIVYREKGETLECCCYPRIPDRVFSSIDEPLYPIEMGSTKIERRRQWASVILFRNTIKFIYSNREYLGFEKDGLLEFGAEHDELRRQLFKYRMALINTLAWESSSWKKRMLIEKGIKFPVILELKSPE